MNFAFGKMFRAVRLSLTAPPGSPARLTPRRRRILLLAFLAYPLLEAVNWFCLLLDEALFPGYRRLEIREPLFIVGVPRSGTTFLHRLLARDERFTSMRLWEILFAPSIVQKRLWLAAARLDRRLGNPLGRALAAWEARNFAGLNAAHPTSLFAPEEDSLLLLHIFDSIFLIFFFPFPGEWDRLVLFDENVPEGERRGVMRFYRRCLQKHLHVFGRHRRYLSKNPTFTGMILSLREHFPDGRVVCLARTPLEAIPSSVSMLGLLYGLFLDPPSPQPLVDSTLMMARAWYDYTPRVMPAMPERLQAVVRYDALLADPAGTARGLYRRFGFELSARFEAALEEEARSARAYRSRHRYRPEPYGLSREAILRDFAGVFDRHGFPRPEAATRAAGESEP